MGVVQVLESLKKVDKELYLSEFEDGTEVVYFLPSHVEAQRYARLLASVEYNEELSNLVCEHIFKECTVDHYLLSDDFIPAGIIFSTVRHILYLSSCFYSSFEEINEALSIHRSIDNNYIGEIYQTICSAFSSYKIADLKSLNYQELLEVFVHAEQCLIKKGIIEEEFNFAPKEKPQQESIGDLIKKDIKQYSKFQYDNTDKIAY